jgi:uncharacterized protein DUF5658
LTAKRIWLAGLALFALLSATDFAQTYALISQSDGGVYEANPVAGAWLERHGWGGLAAFKVGAVAVFTGAAALLLVRRPKAGAGVMALGCAALLSVTIYSSQLLAAARRPVETAPYVVVNPRLVRTLPDQPATSDGPRFRRTLPPRPVATD